MNLDRRIELWSRWFMDQIVLWSLIGWNRVCEMWEAFSEYALRIFTHLVHAHKRDVWMFLNENELPFCAKEGIHHFTVPPQTLFYYPDTNTFRLNDRLQEVRTRRFDVVSVILRMENNNQVDISSFFHSITWRQHGVPSLWEVVEVYWIHQNLPSAHELKNRWSLLVMDSDTEEHTIALDSPIARRRFSGWV